MDHFESLLLVVGALYLYESLVVPPSAWVVLDGGIRGRLRVTPGRTRTGEARRAMRIARLLPSFGRVFLVPEGPFVMAPASPGRGGPGTSSQEGPQRSGLDVVFANGTTCRFSSMEDAAAWHLAFTEAARHRDERQVASFRSLLADRTRIADIRALAQSTLNASRALRLAGGLQFALLAAWMLVLVILGAFQGLAVYLLAGVAATHVVLVGLVWRARRLAPSAGGHGIAMFALSPLMCMRAGEQLYRLTFQRFEPAAVALALARPEAFGELCMSTMRSISEMRRQPGAQDCALLESALRAREESIARLLRAAGLRMGQLEALAFFDDRTARSYCPSCWTVYAVARGFCRECEGVRLREVNAGSRQFAERILERLSQRQERAGAGP